MKRPVAYRVPDHNGGIVLQSELAAQIEAEHRGVQYQGLYVRDGSPWPDDWQPIETAPTGDDDFFLVCCDDPSDSRSPFVVRGSIFKNARKSDTPNHLSLGYLTHWQPLPAKPVRKD